jgi:hypothetical protein
VFAGGNFGPADGMRTNTQGFQNDRLVNGYFTGLKQVVNGYGQEFLHSAVNVDPDYLEAGAAVDLIHPAGQAFAALQVRDYGDRVAGIQASVIRADFLDGSGQFVTQDTRVGEERLVAPESVKIGAANANPAHPDKGFTRAGGRPVNFFDIQLVRLAADNTFHLWAYFPLKS